MTNNTTDYSSIEHMKTKPTDFSSQARWIWHPDGEGINQYVDFVREFDLPSLPEAATLRIAADSNYQLWVNGVPIPGRQFPCYPHDRVFNSCDIARHLRPGSNRIAVLAYFRGQDSFEYRLGRAGLLVDFDAGASRLASDGNWFCRLDPEFRGGLMPRTSGQMGFSVECDARRSDTWMTDAPLDAGWIKAVELDPPIGGYWRSLRGRPLPVDSRMDCVAGSLIARGELLRSAPDDTYAELARRSVASDAGHGKPEDEFSPARRMMQDFRRVCRVPQPATGPWRFDPPAGKGRGAFALFDMGVDQYGELQLVVEAGEGTVLDVAHGEHLDDLGVRAANDGDHYADRFICREGRNEFTVPFRRIGARYLQVHAMFPEGTTTPLVIHSAGVVPREYAGPELGAFRSEDRLLEAVRALSVTTMRRSMGDHFADCPTREQSLYAYDARNTAVFNYYTLGNYDFAEESMRLLGQGQREDGLLELCAPARVYCVIPMFSLVWICAVREHYLFSGRPVLFREFEPVILRILEAFLERTDTATGLTRLFTGNPYWLFYEWAPGLDHFETGQYCAPDGSTRLDAPQNLYLIEAMDALADMLDYEKRESGDWRRRAEALRAAMREVFYDARCGLFASFADNGRNWHFSATTQALALVTGTVAETERPALQRRLFETAGNASNSRIIMTETGERALVGVEGGETPELVPMTLSTLIYGFKALVGAPPDVQQAGYDALMKIYGGMALKGATTLWETEQGADDFRMRGSLCHGWSAAPLWFMQAYLLGVEPAAPGFSRFRVRPHAAGLHHAEGMVPTPHGPIRVAWHREGETLQLKVKSPKGLEHTQ